MMDEMSICKHVHWDGNMYIGYVDNGNSNMTMHDEAPVAKEVLIFMVNSVNGRWRLPV